MTFCFIQFRQNDVRANDVSGKRRSAEWRVVKMTFGIVNLREIDDSAKWRFGQMTFGNFFSPKQRFGEIAFLQNDDSMKWRFGKMMWPLFMAVAINSECDTSKIIPVYKTSGNFLDKWTKRDDGCQLLVFLMFHFKPWI